MRALSPLAIALCLAACVDADPPALRTLVTVIAMQDGQPAEEATVRLVEHGRRSLVVIEAALHIAPPPGRKRLVRAIRRLGDEDGAALLGHVARYDEDAGVRTEARDALAAWAKDASGSGLSAAALRALSSLP